MNDMSLICCPDLLKSKAWDRAQPSLHPVVSLGPCSQGSSTIGINLEPRGHRSGRTGRDLPGVTKAVLMTWKLSCGRAAVPPRNSDTSVSPLLCLIPLHLASLPPTK